MWVYLVKGTHFKEASKHKTFNKSCAKNQQLGEGQFGVIFDVQPGKEKEADDMRLAWRKGEKSEDINKQVSGIIPDNNEEVNDEDHQTDESEDDETFLVKYDDNRNYIGQQNGWS